MNLLTPDRTIWYVLHQMEQTESIRRRVGSRPKPNLTLLEARIRQGLSREDLGLMAGISAKQVGLIERGVARRPRVSTLHGIARALEADLFELFPERRRP
jgi:DNA-binding XRE family transcriptional regulator